MDPGTRMAALADGMGAPEAEVALRSGSRIPLRNRAGDGRMEGIPQDPHSDQGHSRGHRTQRNGEGRNTLELLGGIPEEMGRRSWIQRHNFHAFRSRRGEEDTKRTNSHKNRGVEEDHRIPWRLLALGDRVLNSEGCNGDGHQGRVGEARRTWRVLLVDLSSSYQPCYDGWYSIWN